MIQLLHLERRNQMAKVSPFHSKNQDHYHDNDKCGAGAEIPAYDRVQGTGGKEKCKTARRLTANDYLRFRTNVIAHFGPTGSPSCML